MAYDSFPNDAHNSRSVTLAEHEQIVTAFGLSGLLFYSGTTPVFADSTGMQVKLRAGVVASIRGTRFNNSSETIIPIAGNTSGNTRLDLVVLRLRKTESAVGVGDQYTVAPFVIQGAPASTPVAPSPVRNTTSGSGVWDVPLAVVTVPNNATTIAPTQMSSQACYVSGSGYVGREDWAKPPLLDTGVEFFAADTGRTWVCDGSRWLERSPVFKGKPATEQLAANTALQNDDHLFVPVEPSAVYEMVVVLRYDGDPGGDLQTGWTLPAGAAWNYIGLGLGVTAVLYGDDQTGAFTAADTPSFGAIGVGTNCAVMLRGLLTTSSAGGTVQLRWAQRTAHATPTRVFADSYVSLRRVG